MVCSAIYRAAFQRCPSDGGELIDAATDPLVGTTIAQRYVIDAVLGEGGMGRVYRAHHHRLLAKRYAIKVLHGDLALSATMRIRFANEARNTSRLAHPNIVEVVDLGRTEAGLLYLVMDLVDGPTLGRLVQGGPMAPPRVVRIASQLSRGLAYAHSAGVVHRDFKPDNILVADGDVARIADFGLSLSVREDDARLTSSGVLCTPAYAAPEQIVGAAIDHRADLYALGGTLFEMVTGGVLPFGRDPRAIGAKLATAAPRAAEAAPGTPPRLAAIIDRLLARDPEGRFGSADDVADELDRVDRAGTAPTMRAETVVRRPRQIAIAVAAAAAISLALSHPAVAPAPAAVSTPALSIPPLPRGPVIPQVVPPPAAPAPHRPHRAPAPHSQAGAPRIASLDVEGGLPPSSVRRAIERALPSLRGCADVVGPREIVAAFSIAETRRAHDVHAEGAGADCVTAALATIRTEAAPDVGDAEVAVRIAFDAAP